MTGWAGRAGVIVAVLATFGLGLLAGVVVDEGGVRHTPGAPVQPAGEPSGPGQATGGLPPSLTEPDAVSPAPSPDATTTKSRRKPVNESGWERWAVAGRTRLPSSRGVTCPPATTVVGTSAELVAALADARPGHVVQLRDGTYRGAFVATLSGTPQQPIHLCGGRGAVLENEGPTSGYVLHLDGAAHWRLVGFSVRNGQKGVMADRTVGSVIQGLTVTDIGDEAIHLRRFSTDNVVADNVISRTGLRREKFGEGIYIGTATSNWCSISDCRPDRSDRNVITGNRITVTTAEAIDVKEGTTGGLVQDNVFDGSALVGADSWVDIKGTAWLIQGNTGAHSPKDGFQTHEILEGWGTRNVFRSNRAAVHGPGYGIALTPVAGNVVTCDNVATEARKGLSNVACS